MPQNTPPDKPGSVLPDPRLQAIRAETNTLSADLKALSAFYEAFEQWSALWKKHGIAPR